MFFLALDLSFFIPLAAGCLLSAIGGKLSKRVLGIYVTGICALTLILVGLTFIGGDFNVTLWRLNDTLSITVGSDGIARLFASVIVSVWLIVSVYAIDYMRHDGNEVSFFSFYLIVLGMLILLSFSANLFTMYLFFELMTLTTLPLVFHTVCFKHLLYSAAGALCALSGVIFLYRFGASLTFSLGGTLDKTLSVDDKNLLLAFVFVTIIGFGAKAGMFPFDAWRTAAAYTASPTPASAVLSGVITNAGILCVIRTVYFVTGADFLRGTWVQYTWVILALINIIMSPMMAYKEKFLKKQLAFLTISQASYIMLGLALLDNAAANGSLLHIIFYSVIMNGLFLAAGAFIFKTGMHRSDELRGIGRRMPVTLWCFTLLSLALIGVPPMSGFVSKWYLASGALDSNLGALVWIVPAAVLLSTLLTAGCLLKIVIAGFFAGSDFDETTLKADAADPLKNMLIPIIILTAASVLLGICASPIVEAIKNLIL